MVQGPLSGVTVLDLTRVLAGPFCTLILQDLGARVIKVEVPGLGDEARGTGPFVDGHSTYFASINRGKESIALDLKDKTDRSIFMQLASRADVLTENYRPGVMDKLGLGWDVLHAHNPRLVYAAVSGFGHSGPYSQRPAYDMVVQAMGGIMSMTGHPGGEPTRVGTSVGDVTAGLFTTIGIQAALRHRDQTGQGQKVDVAMLDCQLAILENAIVRYTATGEVPRPLGARHPSIVPFAAFPTADGHVIIAAGNDALFVRMCEALERPDMARDARYQTNAKRAEQVGALALEIEEVLRHKPTAHWLKVLEAARVPCGPINDISQVVADPQVAARNMLVSVEGLEDGPIRVAGNPIKMSAFEDPTHRGPVPRLDEHRESLLKEFKISV
ncbi:MAG: CaiB/BaiF CoA-transferase family protein [Proteobacteria bacterium]|nr:CaiB/BaiF CoA-transferase family protein [Pseudomonadota bacterium]MDA1071371.1 CaiB/BaiF CoA-transferase family protein [Pseudomonadota bacterium]